MNGFELKWRMKYLLLSPALSSKRQICFFTLFCSIRQGNELKCVLHVKHTYLSRLDLWHNCILAFSWPQPPSLLKLPHKCSRRVDPGKLGTNQMVRAIVGFQVLSASKPFGPTDTADYISTSSKAKSILTVFISIFSVIFLSRVLGRA